MCKDFKPNEIAGEKIRRQYFHIPIYLVLSMSTTLLFVWTAVAIQNAETDFAQWLDFTIILLLLSAALLIPLGILSVLNRYFFGEVVCVLDDRGLHCESGFVKWEHIKKAVYNPDLPGSKAFRFYCCNELCLTIKPFHKSIQVEIAHAPFLLFRKIKKRCPEISCKMSTVGIVMVSCMTFGMWIVGALCVLAA